MSKLKIYLEELRAPFFTGSVTPALLGAAVAWERTGHLNLFLLFLTVLGVVFLHGGANVINDYFDHLSGTDDVNIEYIRPFTGGSRMIQNGTMTPKEVLTEALALYAMAAAVGAYLTWVCGPAVPALGAIGVFSGFFYCAPPFKLVHRGIGEFFIGLNFGVLITLGAYYVQARSFAWEAFVASIPMALLITAILYINEFPDEAADRAVGKRHLVVRLGKKRAVIGYAIIMAATYATIIVGVIARWLNPWALSGLVAAPIAAKAVMVARKNYDDSKALEPANGLTIISHLVTGLALSAGYIIAGKW